MASFEAGKEHFGTTAISPQQSCDRTSQHGASTCHAVLDRDVSGRRHRSRATSRFWLRSRRSYTYDFGDSWRHNLEKLLVCPRPRLPPASRARAAARPRTSAEHTATSNSCACCLAPNPTRSKSSGT
jgi:hypothetical protein